MTAFLITATLAFFFMGVIWSKDGLPNVALKLIWIGLGFWGFALSLQALGYIVKG